MSDQKRRHNALPDGYKLHWYEIHGILGRGGFGITYLALDTNLNHEVAIKEFLPTDLAMRASDSSIHPISDDHSDTFEWGLNRFITEAQTLAQFRHPNIVLVHSVFEANGTAYMVMEYEKGESLDQAYNLKRLTTEDELLAVLFPLMDGLQRIHKSGFVHRDIKPKNIYLRDDGRPVLLDFGFNGWGLKFPADLDNRITRRLHERGVFGPVPCPPQGLILEGGSIESDGRGTILTTAECLLNANRNPHLRRGEIETELRSRLGAERFLWLENGYLAGDDTDSHIDTLARLCPEDTILYVTCDDEKDEHFTALSCMADELRAFRTRDGRPFRLIPLPWPAPRYDEEGQRLPATYANFLVINGAVLVPTYGDKRDGAALDAVGQAYPNRAIIGVDCSPLILQHGSLHCVTMQLPKGTLQC